MAVERTFSIVKPDAVERNLIGQIYSRFEEGGLRIVASKMLRLTQAQAEGFYAEHAERPFFKDLVAGARRRQRGGYQSHANGGHQSRRG